MIFDYILDSTEYFRIIYRVDNQSDVHQSYSLGIEIRLQEEIISTHFVLREILVCFFFLSSAIVLIPWSSLVFQSSNMRFDIPSKTSFCNKDKKSAQHSMKCSYANTLKNPWDREHFTKGQEVHWILTQFFFGRSLYYLNTIWDIYCNDDSVGVKGPPRKFND